MLCSKLHYQKGFNLVIFSYKVFPKWDARSSVVCVRARLGQTSDQGAKQVMVLLVQHYKGPRFFVPRRSLPSPLSSDTMYWLISFRESTPPQNRQVNIVVSNNKQQVDDFVGGLTFQDWLRKTFCEMSFRAKREQLERFYWPWPGS